MQRESVARPLPVGAGAGGSMPRVLVGWAGVILSGMVLALVTGGCAFGPRELGRTHGPYTDAVRLVYEEQLLRNLVHLRYNEPSSSVDISSITAQFELSAQAEARPFF